MAPFLGLVKRRMMESPTPTTTRSASSATIGRNCSAKMFSQTSLARAPGGPRHSAAALFDRGALALRVGAAARAPLTSFSAGPQMDSASLHAHDMWAARIRRSPFLHTNAGFCDADKHK